MKIAILLAVFILSLQFIINIPDANLLEGAKKLISSPPELIISQGGAGVYWNRGVHSLDALLAGFGIKQTIESSRRNRC